MSLEDPIDAKRDEETNRLRRELSYTSQKTIGCEQLSF